MAKSEKTTRPDIGACTRYWPANTESKNVYQDSTGELWTEFPDDPPVYSHIEGSYMVNGMPVYSCGDVYLLDYTLADYLE